jgi:hypothetical protein
MVGLRSDLGTGAELTPCPQAPPARRRQKIRELNAAGLPLGRDTNLRRQTAGVVARMARAI